ncbi:Acyl-CoA ligase sidI [Cladobotryum mycophilum]|uniref:Acyl-CoA ligase sidI n=1 Tax=Cladobotryum mycophilum TaxID=491253 RepID=A0ABR0SPF1_9HYPO
MWENPVQVEDGMAYWVGTSKVPLVDTTMGQMLACAARDWPSKIAVKAGGRALTYKELNDEVEAVACGLQSLGVEAESRVAISLGNCTEYIVMVLACGRLGAISVTLNPLYTPQQTIAAMNHISACCLLTSKKITPPYKPPQTNIPLLTRLLTPLQKEAIISAVVPSLHLVLLVDNGVVDTECAGITKTTDYYSLVGLNRENRLMAPIKLDPNSITNIQFTSGTTSMPKAVSLTHRGLLNNARHIGQSMRYTTSDIICCPFPLYHCSGLVTGFLSSLVHGATIIFPSESFHPATVLSCIKHDKPTVLHGVPTMFEAILDEMAKNDLPEVGHLRSGLIGGSPIPSSLRCRIHERLNLPDLVNGYGMTELSPLATVTPLDGLDRKLNTAGQVIPHCGVRVVARDDPSKTLRTGEKGEIIFSGFLVMPGYWKDPGRTAQAIYKEWHADGSGYTRWLRTGDEGLIDEDGFIHITSRIKDIIIRGGENIYPPEIETCLTQHPKIRSAAVVGLPDAKLGEVVAAFLVMSPDLDVEVTGDPFAFDMRNIKGTVDPKNGLLERTSPETIDAVVPNRVCRYVQTYLARHMVPKYLFWVSEMPFTASGKIEKYKLRDEALRLLN